MNKILARLDSSEERFAEIIAETSVLGGVIRGSTFSERVTRSLCQ